MFHNRKKYIIEKFILYTQYFRIFSKRHKLNNKRIEVRIVKGKSALFFEKTLDLNNQNRKGDSPFINDELEKGE